MMQRILENAVGNVSDCFILEYDGYQPKKTGFWRLAVAACLILSFFMVGFLRYNRYIAPENLPQMIVDGNFSLTNMLSVAPEGCAEEDTDADAIARLFGCSELPQSENRRVLRRLEGTVHSVSLVFLGDDDSCVFVIMDPNGGEAALQRGTSHGGRQTFVKGYQVIYGKGASSTSVEKCQFLWMRRGNEGIQIVSTPGSEALVEQVYRLILATDRNYNTLQS